jgi:hypothetical protein
MTMTTAVSVIYVHKWDAKIIKTQLENASYLDKRYRMTTASLTVGGEEKSDVEVTWCHHHYRRHHHDSALVPTGTGVHNECNAGNCGSRFDDGEGNDDGTEKIQKCIAVPVTEECMRRVHQQYQHYLKNGTTVIDENNQTSAEDNNDDETKVEYCDQIDFFCTKEIRRRVLGFGRYSCPYSTSMLGNNNNFVKNRHLGGDTSPRLKLSCSTNLNHRYSSCSSNENGSIDSPLTNIQHILLETLIDWLRDNGNNRTLQNTANNNTRQTLPQHTVETIEPLVRGLSMQTCPRKLEILGDDHTLVIPRWAFFIVREKNDSNEVKNTEPSVILKKMQQEKERREFRDLLRQLIHDEVNDGDAAIVMCAMQSRLWTNLAINFNSSRVVRRGDVNPDSGIRESGHRIVWPIPHDESTIVCNHGYIPAQTGVNSPGWITVTEHGIVQSFDITRVMFSRGNVTEKKRFGSSLVQPGEKVLDMYAGIGYYTLPALMHGKARHVTACEWNKHALFALKHNLRANGVPEANVSVLEGDCRVNLKRLIDQQKPANDIAEYAEVEEINQFDRISLGLLPSCEGGWPVAVSCLRKSTGGWLHVHGNVATLELDRWTHWLCHTLSQCAAHDGRNDWIAVCAHVEKVKSFAPKVDHVVADVFVGPPTSPKVPLSWNQKATGVFNSVGSFVPTSSVDISPPSCALNEDGILHQSWMR